MDDSPSGGSDTRSCHELCRRTQSPVGVTDCRGIPRIPDASHPEKEMSVILTLVLLHAFVFMYFIIPVPDHMGWGYPDKQAIGYIRPEWIDKQGRWTERFYAYQAVSAPVLRCESVAVSARRIWGPVHSDEGRETPVSLLRRGDWVPIPVADCLMREVR
jgi:hypothetical protein